MRKSVGGFTIVELLIVVVVIAILAAITIVSYNGIQTRTKNTKTISVVNTWVKGLHLYKAEQGSLPDNNSCFGDMTTYDGNGQCWNGSTWKVKQSFLDSLKPYMSGFPSPDTSQIDSVNQPDRRGAFYQVTSGGTHYVWVNLLGNPACPEISGLEYNTQGSGTEGKYCRYIIN